MLISVELLLNMSPLKILDHLQNTYFSIIILMTRKISPSSSTTRKTSKTRRWLIDLSHLDPLRTIKKTVSRWSLIIFCSCTAICFFHRNWRSYRKKALNLKRSTMLDQSQSDNQMILKYWNLWTKKGPQLSRMNEKMLTKAIIMESTRATLYLITLRATTESRSAST